MSKYRMEQIQKFQKINENIHESIFQSYHILDKVLQMIDRGDSKETIFEVVEFLRNKEASKL